MRTASLGSSEPAATASVPRARAVAVPKQERARRRLVGVVLLVYLLLIFEGSLRKWVLPELSLYIFFIRDPFVLCAYLYATLHGLWPKRKVFLVVCVGMGALGLVVGSIQLVVDSAESTRLLLAAYGWRSYFLYAPLAFLIGTHFRVDDLTRVYRWTLLLCVPMGVLVAAQFFAPPNSAINVGSATDSALQFLGLGQTGEHTRPMGTFSSGAGQIQFVASAFAILLGLMIAAPKDRRVSRWLLLVAAGGFATCLALSGSRGTMLHCAFIALLGMGLGLVGRTAKLKLRAIALPLLVATVFVALYPVVFPRGFEAFTSRWEAAADAEEQMFRAGVIGRALYGFVDFMRLLDRAPVLGYGLGLGGNASTTLGVEIEGGNALTLAETDWARHIVDLGPIFGSAYIVFRIALVIWLGVLVLKATRRGAGPMPLLLYAYVGYVLLLGQITGQGAINGYAWLFTGFCLAAMQAQVAPQPSRAVPRASAAPWRRAAARFGKAAQRG